METKATVERFKNGSFDDVLMDMLVGVNCLDEDLTVDYWWPLVALPCLAGADSDTVNAAASRALRLMDGYDVWELRRECRADRWCEDD